MQNIVIDLEWNQPLGNSLYINEPIRLNGDIIEIGAVKLDDQFRPTDTYRGYVKPQYYTKMHRKVGGLTHIDPNALKEAPMFEKAWSEFMAWCGDDVRFLVWGNSDMSMIRENLRIRGLPCGLPPCCDLQEVFEDQVTRDNRQWSLTDAMKMKGLPMLTAHDATNDAINTARLCDCLYMDEGLEFFTDEVPPVKDELYVKDEAASDEMIRVFPCPSCGCAVRVNDAWDAETDEYFPTCVNCGELSVVYKKAAVAGGKMHVTRTIRPFYPGSEDDE